MVQRDATVSGWCPDFRPADDQIGRHSARLRALAGRQLTDVWTVWIVAGDWFPDLPVVMRFDDGTQLEVCWEKFDDLSLTWNNIDLTNAPRAWVEQPLEWRRDAHPSLASISGGTVTGVRATSFLFETRDPDSQAGKNASWFTSGLWLATSRGDFRVFNALDENGLSAEPPQPTETLRSRPI